MTKNILVFAFLLSVCFAVSGQSAEGPVFTLRLKSGNVHLVENIDSFVQTDQLPPNALFDGKYYLVASFSNIPLKVQVDELKGNGVELLYYLPEQSYFISVPVSCPVNNLKKAGIKSLLVLGTEQKISGALLRTPLPEWTISSEGKLKINLYYFPGCRYNALTDYTASKGMLTIDHVSNLHLIVLSIDAPQLTELASQPFVHNIEYASPPIIPDNQPGVNDHRVNVLSAEIAGRNLKGSGVAVGVGDGGYVTPHLDFQNRQTNFASSVLSGWGDHCDHVTGTIGGAGVINRNYTGMAPKVTLYAHQSSNFVANTSYYYTNYGIVLTNNSYGYASSCGYFGLYDGVSSALDQLLIQSPAVNHVFAASNDGGTSCSPYPAGFATMSEGFGASKNVITVGAVSDLDAIATFSSRGPCIDGRLKPDICGVGTLVTSTIPSNSYGTKNGTSMATPGVTGTLALLYERFKQLNLGVNPDGALIKAIVMNTSDDIGNPGPDFRHGYGRLNARRAVEAIEANHYTTGNISQNDSLTYSISVPSGALQLRVLIYWRDKEGSSNAAPALVNNIDMHVLTPSASQFRPWVLDTTPTLVNNNATRGIDNLNNTEQVTIDNPASGNFIVSLIGKNIPFGPQGYVLTWEFVMPSLTITYPTGGEKLNPGSTERIRFDAYGASSGTYQLEYSINNGASWNNITSFSYTTTAYDWTIPNAISSTCQLRITHSSNTALSDTSGVFTIIGIPNMLTGSSSNCGGQVLLQWSGVSGAVSYNVMRLSGNNWNTIGTTDKIYFADNTVSAGNSYWYSVIAQGVAGEISNPDTGISITVANTACNYTQFDAGVTGISSPKSGRQFTTSALGSNHVVSIEIKNYGTSAMSNFPVSYQVGSNPVITETYSGTINANTAASYSFTSKANFSSTGTYSIKTWIKISGDSLQSNDTLTQTIYHLINPPDTLPFADGFEGAIDTIVNTEYAGLAGMRHWDYQNNSAQCRLRTTGSAALTKAGSHSIFLDKSSNTAGANYNHLILTLNLSNYSSSNGLRLNFSYAQTGEEQNSNDSIWVRGSDTNTWIPVYSLWANKVAAGTYANVSNLDLSTLLSAAGQVPSASFQIRFGQEDNAMQSSISDSDGFVFDEITISDVSSDAQLVSLNAPEVLGCGLTNTQAVSVWIKNNAVTPLSNIPLSFRFNGGAVVTDTFAGPLAAGNTALYIFTTTIDMSSPGAYTFDTWIANPGDGNRSNDSLMGTIVLRTARATITSSSSFLEDFESGNGGFVATGTNSSWQWGVPSKTNMDTAANGTKAWVTNLTGNYNNNEYSYLYTPCFQFSGLGAGANIIISFNLKFITEAVSDKAWMEFSSDGMTWYKISDSGGTNWYNSSPFAWHNTNNKWQVTSTSISTTLTGTTDVRFRFVFSSDGGTTEAGIALDDFHVYWNTSPSIYSGIPVKVAATSTGTGWNTFTSGGQRIAMIHDNNKNLGLINVRVSAGNTDRTYAGQHVLGRNWAIKPTDTTATGPFTVRLYFLSSEFDSFDMADNVVSSIHQFGITKYNGVNEDYIFDNDTGTFTFILPQDIKKEPYNNGYYLEFTVNSFSEFWVNGGGLLHTTPLPVQWLNFSALQAGKDALLQWSTASEINNESFSVEVASGSNMSFRELGQLNGKGNSQIINNYRYLDTEPDKNGTRYYRIKQTDFNGKSSYSTVKPLTFNSEKIQIQLQPNPSGGEVALTIFNGCDKHVTVCLYDYTGRLLSKEFHPLNHSASCILQIHSSGQLPPGIYFIKAYLGQEVYDFKLIRN